MEFVNNKVKKCVSIKLFLCVVFCFVCMTLFREMVLSRQIVDITKQHKEVTQMAPGIRRYIDQISSIQDNSQDKVQTKNSRVLCLILTSYITFRSRVPAVNATWARRCDKQFYVLKTEKKAPDIINSPFEETRNNIVHKIKFALSYIYENHIDDFDWLIKADDDTYVIMENLKFLVQNLDGQKPAYLGFHFDKFVQNGYMSGGAGYVISNRALRNLVQLGFYPEKCPVIPNKEDPENSEDIEIGRCLNKTGVPVINSLDEEGKERFHPYPTQKHLFGSIPRFVFEWAKNPHNEGMACCSKYSISFHYMDPASMLLVDHLLYRTSVAGLDRVNSKIT
ncbi:glycoprotein-N-acetylgalactosamine 3-beta-galactosyltransferase 1-like isoform X2 [Ruditapes philippinarum]|uniref:glycoprotein-N-acetylgalactosamine 3-beta-galactosyltransferase 1-like isoform X2 n=1 Tax=Ruditapes philippinarum TaxID=129788 RepID=UPI00295BEBBD|nr:glycoprotein-N-acetylgalactosamine 3-beta-galactosyltransferase 1-like isoform X2 [Ruditapes philippinarum]